MISSSIAPMITTKRTALMVAMSAILGVAPTAALAQPTQVALIDDRDTNTQVNSAPFAHLQGEGDFNTQAASVSQSNNLEDNDANAIIQTNCKIVTFC
jgi:hypothetical protein